MLFKRLSLLTVVLYFFAISDKVCPCLIVMVLRLEVRRLLLEERRVDFDEADVERSADTSPAVGMATVLRLVKSSSAR